MMIGFAISLIFSPLAGLAAYVIAYEEYRHHFPTPGPARRMALQMAVVAFLVFLVLPVVAAALIRASL